MALLLHRSDSPLALADGLADVLRHEPLDVFTPEVIVVGARGVERWLTQRLSHQLGQDRGGDGVSAGLDVRTPASLMALLLDRERDDPWLPDRLVWPTLEALDACVREPGFEAVARHLGADAQPSLSAELWEHRARRSRRYAVARRLAGLFASYARERPTLIEAWEAGRDEDGLGQELAPDLIWQATLWRATVDLIIERGLATESPTARHRRVVAGLRNGSLELRGLPPRLSLFGHTRLPEADLELLDALGTRMQVHLWLPHPSPQLWEDLSQQTTLVPRLQDESAEAAHHPLLASLGRDVRELERMLLHRSVTETVATSHVEGVEPTTRLQLMQSDIRRNVPPSITPAIASSDRSVQVHACHGPARQVEVLREVLVHLLDSSQGRLQPRDIVVMCPDIETFAPLLHATFGSARDGYEAQAHPGQSIRVQLADRSLSATNPLVETAERVIQLVSGRVGASEILDLLALPPVAACFGFDEEALDVLGRWIAGSGIRWGIDGQHRGEYGLAGLEANTWEAGLDRIALGVAVAEDSSSAAHAFLPIDDVGSGAIDTAAGLLELLDVLEEAARYIRSAENNGQRGVMSVAAWVKWLRSTVLALTEVSESDRWQIAQFERELGLIGEAAGENTQLRLTDVRVMMQQRWSARPTRSNFRTGAVTVCTMVPMRSIPHKVVIALGLDDGHYPRTPVVDGDDVLARLPLTGEREARAEDNQLLLDAVMAAQEYFIALYSGFDERTGAPKPPAVPLQQLISAAARTGAGSRDAETPERNGGVLPPPFVISHPLQAFDERNFTSASFIAGGTYDTHARDGAAALREARTSPPPQRTLLPEPLPERAENAVGLEDLASFYSHPARAFLRQRLDITVTRTADEPSNEIPIVLDRLEQWPIGDRLLSAQLQGVPLAQAVEAERRRGQLPPGALGEPFLQDISRKVHGIMASSGTRDRTSQDVLVDLSSGVRVRGVVGSIVRDTANASGDYIETLTYSSISPKHVIDAWVRLVAITASGNSTVSRSVLRGKRASVTLLAPSPDESLALLTDLVDFREKGMRFPLGVPPKAASAFTHQYHARLNRYPEDHEGAIRAGLQAADRVWTSGLYPERADDPWWARIYGAHSSAADLNSWNSLAYWGPRIWGPIHAAGGRI